MPSNAGRPPYDDILTPAEWRTVHAVRHGLSNREIAERRGISRDGVKYHVANAVAKLGLENRAALKSWRGVPKGSALHRSGLNNRGKDMTDETAVIGLGQVARTVSDIGRSETWYRDVLGLPHLYTFGKIAFFDCGGTRLMLSEDENPSQAESILYFRVLDIDATYEALGQRGAESINAPHMIHRHADGTEEWMAFFKDPDDRPVAIMASVAATEPA